MASVSLGKLEKSFLTIRASVLHHKKASEPTDSPKIHTVVMDMTNPFGPGVMMTCLKDSGECIFYFKSINGEVGYTTGEKQSIFTKRIAEVVQLCNEMKWPVHDDQSPLRFDDKEYKDLITFYLVSNQGIREIRDRAAFLTTTTDGNVLFRLTPNAVTSSIGKRIDNLIDDILTVTDTR